MINDALLRKYRTKLMTLAKGEPVFHQGDPAASFHLVKSGRIKMVTYSRDGKEFVQGYFAKGQSFGEPPFFHRVPYPASAVAVERSEVWKCPHEAFVKLLRENFPVHLHLTEVLSERLLYKSMMLSELAVEEAEHRLTTIIDYFRRAERNPAGEEYRVPYTRQQLADMTGMRIETVIRCVKSMEQKGLLRLTQGGKITWKKHLEKKR
jgi:CRP-like cAMP-binding protein